MGKLRTIILAVVGAAHLIILLVVTIPVETTEQKLDPGADVFKLVDVQEFRPPPPETEKPPPEETVTVENQVATAAQVIETERVVVEVDEPVYLPQHQISVIPVLPTETILERIIYPDLAARQGLEGVVYLELFIDATGKIRRVEVLRDPGHGFAQAAVAALRDIKVRPALSNGEPVAVRYRYPVRFTLNK